jgi:predicted enzyme related to lactoylglutathione lyase
VVVVKVAGTDICTLFKTLLSKLLVLQQMPTILYKSKKMNSKIKFVHTNLIAKDWRKLAQFYIDVFDCEPVFPERDLSGEWIDKLTRISAAEIKGIHLQLPGYQDGPTLEIFEYNRFSERDHDPVINDQGLGHIAFHTTDVETVLNKLLANGGEKYGELVEKSIQGLGTIKVIYAKDPEGNIIEIQHWQK